MLRKLFLAIWGGLGGHSKYSRIFIFCGGLGIYTLLVQTFVSHVVFSRAFATVRTLCSAGTETAGEGEQKD